MTITVQPTQPPGTPPNAADDAYGADQDTALTVTAPVGVLANDTGDALTAAHISGPQHGSLTLNADGSFTYTPDAGYSGSDSFAYQPLQTAPAPTRPSRRSPSHGPSSRPSRAPTPTTPRRTPPLRSRTPPACWPTTPERRLTAAPISGPEHGRLTLNADGSFAYTPVAGFNGADSFSYRGARRGWTVSEVAQRHAHRPTR